MAAGDDTLARVPTSINGFDRVALGGLPKGRCTLVTGTAGSGKTLFAVEFLARGRQRFGDPGVFVTFEEPPADIRRNAASLGFDIAAWEAEGAWAFVDASADITEEGPTVGTYDFGALVARITHAVRSTRATRVSLDSLGAIFTRFPDKAVVRHELFRIATTLENLGVTSVLTAERTDEYGGISRYDVEEFVLNNVIVLRNGLHRERRRRTVEIVKLRGAPHRTGEWLFTIDPRDGIVVIPLAFLPFDKGSVRRDRVSCGIPELDDMCGGGFFRDAVVLLSGPTGVGKTLTALSFMIAGVDAGERCLLYTFDETEEQLRRSIAGWGVDLAQMDATGLLNVVSEYPETSSLEDHFIRIRRSVDEFRPQRLVIDTLSALERIATPRALLDFVIALGAVLRPQGVTTLLTALPGQLYPGPGSPSIAGQVASLTDVAILLRYIESPGHVGRAVTVLQTRGSAHDHRVRAVTIDHTGLHVGAPLRGVSNILAGYGSPLMDTRPWPAGTAEGTPQTEPHE
ncbi:circadian clock protein KaiC [Streptomyces sp. NPDC003077]|uniref:circadian clock protein KaiC n=1 Tax=Streptomyces sp. NPDC003077 TaxID=3154443 RepID=UPI0033BBE6A8